eukprot:SAG11_NODE_913_length_6579_cov_3.562963_4_plen_63_part_00
MCQAVRPNGAAFAACSECGYVDMPSLEQSEQVEALIEASEEPLDPEVELLEPEAESLEPEAE